MKISYIPNCVIISNGTVTTCSANFFDAGGPGSNYPDQTTLVQTFTPATPGNRIKIVWNSFVSESTYDFITIYDGPDATSPIIYGPASGTLSIPVNVSSHASGSLTVKFTSDETFTGIESVPDAGP